MCVSRMHQMQVVHERDPMNRIQWWKLLTKVRKPPIGIMESKTMHKCRCVNRFLAFEHKGNPPVNDQWGDVDCWVQGYLPIMKVGAGCTIWLQLYVTMRHTEGMADMQSQEFWEWSTQIDKPPLNKSMRHMEESRSIDSMMKPWDAWGMNQTLHRDWKSNQLGE